jgi:hypothetical protein
LFGGFLHHHILGLDFEHGPWVAGRALLHGGGPYVDPSSPSLVSGEPFVYPAAAAVLLAPFALLPQATAGAIFAILCIGAALLALRVLEVRDWRVYGAVLTWPPLIMGWQFANISVALVLGVAVCWRYRDRPPVVGAMVALLFALKVYLWPLGLWLLATRRYAAATYAVAWALAINLATWAIVGFDQLSRYGALMRALIKFQEWYGYSLVALALNVGAGRPAAYALAFSVAAVAGAACVLLGRRGRDHAAFALCLAVSLLATPIFWPHYYVLLLVPLAIVRPRFSLIWLLPMTWLLPGLLWTASTRLGRWPGPGPACVALAIGVVFTAIAIREVVRPTDGAEPPDHRPLRLAAGRAQ